MEDIDKVLAYEIKKDIADRYFNFRKMIERDSAAYIKAVLDATVELEASVGLDLIRLYILLGEPSLIRKFQALIGIAHDLYYDSYICSSPTIRKRLFAGYPVKGLTRRSRLRLLFSSIYRRLQTQSVTYQETRNQLIEEQETIREQITLFYQKNDLQNILSFLRSLDHDESHAILQTNTTSGDRSALERKLEMVPPEPADNLLPDVPVLPPLKTIKKPLFALLDTALKNPPELDVKTLCSP
ncbi:hypothetical protein [Desulfofustis glycolicus]|uniref:Uncharacterized protein n=1 Tax=Desulfofustis glycolicus DSM 9705 TaxID=1121409 RepID=A0A1M5UXD6_9BACT|nr:hypothetical protein [Desulfofustis glycolicus]MCB2215903.1 hypothetical protein [Desulfobulbaceae bacterium]SHH67363.1 hypothetical protein SAMN02745124_01365 [Desulfofustis glycolicus DSM 9705]